VSTTPTMPIDDPVALADREALERDRLLQQQIYDTNRRFDNLVAGPLRLTPRRR
jgi:hypothetical protein